MKLRFVRGREKRGRVLVATLRGNESVSTGRLRWLMSHAHKNLLPCEYDPARRRLRYDVRGLTSLKRYVRHSEPSHAALVRMLKGITDAMAWCMSSGSKCYHLLNDPSHVFVGTTWEPHLVLLPVDGASSLIERSPFETLTLLSDTAKVRYLTPDAVELAHGLADFVLEQDGIFSINALRHFVRRECRT